MENEIKFGDFKSAIQKKFTEIAQTDLFTVGVDKYTIWETYLESFPEGTNEIYRERRENDCQHCKQFIRACGDVVTIIDNKLVSIWDINIGSHYQVVADQMSKLVKSNLIQKIFISSELSLGVDSNIQLLDNGDILKWEHLYFKLPNKFVKRKDDIGTYVSKITSDKDVFKRSLQEIQISAAETVSELIDQNSLYRGEEHKGIIDLFIKHKTAFNLISDDIEMDNYCWINSIKIGSASRIRNTVIGTLLVDISDGKKLDDAVSMFESKVAPTNYKRPTALITKKMVENAEKKVKELGIEQSLIRRYAVTDDLTVNNVIYVDREIKKEMGIFDNLKKDLPENLKDLKKVEEVDINTFIDTILPKINNMQLLVENNHINNFMSLIAPNDDQSKKIFNWDNNFSWSYNGDITDSIKERVKNAGGNVNGVLRCSLSWYNYDDLDIHIIEPDDGDHIMFSHKRSHTFGELDVDMNAGTIGQSRNAVENIVWPNKNKMIEGEYQLYINNFNKRENIDVGFEVEIEYDGVTYTMFYNKAINKVDVQVATFTFSKKHGIEFIKHIPFSTREQNVWGITTGKYHNVNMIMNSPNHWDDNSIGNKHFFFILDECKNSKPSRGFFNEFLKSELNEHRKVFEVLGSKTKTPKSDNQLSGLGFSSTKKNHVFCKVSGNFTRIIKITF